MSEHPSEAPDRFPGTGRARLLLSAAGLSLLVLGVAILTSTRIDHLAMSAISSWSGRPPNSTWLGKLHTAGGEILFSGFLLFSAGWLIALRGASVLRLARQNRFLTLAAASALLVLWLPIVLVCRSASIAGQRYWWLFDDAMISMRYAQNLAKGLGLVWNPGERVEGYSNFLWTLYMAGVHLLTIPTSKTSLVVLLTNVALAVATVPVLLRLVRVLGGGEIAAMATLASLVFSRDVMAWAAGGLETIFLTFVFLLATCRILEESRRDEPTVTTCVLIATLSLIRADGIVLAGLLYGVSFWLSRNRRKVVIYSAISLLLPAGHEVFRVWYYGDILSNTAYLKTLGWNSRLLSGLRYVLLFGLQYVLLFAFAIFGARPSRRKAQRALLGVIVLYGGYVAYVGGDAFKNFRFLIPILPLLAVLAFLGIESLSWQEAPRMALSVVCLIPFLVPGCLRAIMRYPTDPANVALGLLVRNNTPAGCRVADYYAGSVMYFSERYAIDFLGKSDRYIAHLPAVSSGTTPGHNKFDYDHSIGRLKPDLVIADFHLPVDEETMQSQTTGNQAFIGQLYFHPLFREHCLPNPVKADTWRTIFVCDWSSQMSGRDNWKELPSER